MGTTNLAGWSGPIKDFVEEDRLIVRKALETFIEDAGASQVRAWRDSIPMLQSVLKTMKSLNEGAGIVVDDGTLLEYVLPMEGGRRPDVLVLENGVVVVLEFKGRDRWDISDVDQALGYKRDLENYHSVCQDGQHAVHAILVMTRRTDVVMEKDGVYISGPDDLPALLAEMTQNSDSPPLDAEHFLLGEYLPLPSLIRAAKLHFRERNLPNIRRASANTDPAYLRAQEIINESHETGRRKLILLSGVPGSGKTLVGIRLSYESEFSDLATTRLVARKNGTFQEITPPNASIFLSGNGPLVAVLKNALGRGSNNFIQDVRKYVQHHESGEKRIPLHHVIIFDEAQRAWDKGKVERRHKGSVVGSEPDMFIGMANRIPDWGAVVGLIGTGQEIHDGEESGLQQWVDAVYNTGTQENWDIHAPPGIVEQLNTGEIQVYSEPYLTLNTTIRSHFGEKLHHWVDGVLGHVETPYEDLRDMYVTLKETGFKIYLTSNLRKAKMYLWNRYEKSPEARYGMVCSSRDKSLHEHGMRTLKWPKSPNYGRWYNEHQQHSESCCALDLPFTEFDTQGLELDFTLVGWGTDFILEDGVWNNKRARNYAHTSDIKDPFTLRRNAYRVLLTRARDGMILYLPDTELLGEVRQHLFQSGVEDLDLVDRIQF
ncbi:MAG: DNA/RNA helicase domain-containing protein [Poseidonia sp.]